MESILARALEYTLKYWLKSFTRDQFKLQGRIVQLSNLDVNGDALHASLGLPPALNVTTAKVGKLEIFLPSVSMVQIEPIVVQIDRLDLVLEENDDIDASSNFNSAVSSASIGKGSGYGFADKIADGMTIQVHTVNLLLETHGGARRRGGATWASPMASITMRNLMLYTTNESWEVVNLKEARDFSSDKKFIYVFKKLEWEHLSFDLLPHPDMFTEANFSKFQEGSNRKDEDGAKRVFFGGERFLEGISGEAYITIQRTELNAPLGLEVQLHITEALCPSLSEPGLRALLRFFTGLYVCLNRGDVNPTAQQGSAEAAGRSLVSVAVDHIFICIKDADFRLELLMQSLLFSRASVSDGENAKNLTRVLIGGLFLRDTYSPPLCTLVQPSMQTASVDDTSQVPEFCKNFCPEIYPLGDQHWQLNCSAPLISLHCLQLLPSPIPPTFASRTVIDCQPLMIHLQEESCLRISSFLVDGVIVNSGAVLPDFSVNSLVLNLRGLDVTVPLEIEKLDSSRNCDMPYQSSFSGAKLHIEDLTLSQSPSLKLSLLNLEKDPACFCLWETQPVDASQKKLSVEASLLSLSLETSNNLIGNESSLVESVLWKCVEMKDLCFEVAMVTADGSPLTTVPPPGGVVRVAVACQQYISNTSVEQLFFVLDVYAYFGGISERITILGKNKTGQEVANEPSGGSMMEKVPADTAVNLAVKNLQLRFLESSNHSHEMPLVCFVGDDLSIKVNHRTFGGAMAISSSLRWERVVVDCADALDDLGQEKDYDSTRTENDHFERKIRHKLRTVFWVQNCRTPNSKTTAVPFLDVSISHMIPYSVQDIELHSLNVSACIAGVRLGGGMNYAEYLLHRFGILGPDGGPGDGLTRGLKHLTDGPLSKIFKGSSLIMDGIENGSSEAGKDNSLSHMGAPDDVEISIELKDWLFALEGAEEMTDRVSLHSSKDYDREERNWHTTFQCVRVKSKSNPRVGNTKPRRKLKYPIELITLGMEGLQILKPLVRKDKLYNGITDESGLENGWPTCEKNIVNRHGGVNVEVDIVASEEDDHNDVGDTIVNWMVENVKFSVKDPMEAEVRKDELQHLALLCRSEVESLGRIAAGILRILKLEGSVGSAAINQLSNLGSESFDKIFTPDKLSRGTSPAHDVTVSSRVESTVASLEEAISDSKAKCAALATEMSKLQSLSNYLDDFNHLNEKLGSMQKLLDSLKTQL